LNIGEKRRDSETVFLNERSTGIVVSMAIHALLIFLFLIQPAAKMAAVKTFQISFNEGGESFSQNNPAAPAPDKNSAETQATPALKRAKTQATRVPFEQETIHQKSAIVSPPAAVREVTAEEHPSATEKIAATTLPPASPTIPGDAFAAGTVAQAARPVGGEIASGAGERGSGSGKEGASWSTATSGSGNGVGNGASFGAGSGTPLETRFGETNAPSFIHREIPVYPPLARRRGKEGRVVLTLLIDQAGKVQKIDVTESAGYGLTEAAIEAVKRSTFAPAHAKGKKVASRAVLPIRFKLE